MSNEVSQAEFSRKLGMSRSHVTGLKQAGRLVMSSNGKKVKVKESLALIEATKDPNREDVAKRHASARQTEQPAAPASQMEERVSSTYQQSRAVKERYAALKAKTEYEREIGKLVEVSEVQKAGAEIGTLVRSSLENMVDQMAAELAVESDPAKIHLIMSEHVDHTLKEMHRKLTGSFGGESV